MVNLRAERISGDQNYTVFLENVSENGIHMITTPADIHKKYAPGTKVVLKFRLPSGEVLNLGCRVRWAHYRIPPDKSTDSIGLEIIEKPQRYVEFVRSLHQPLPHDIKTR